MFSNKCFCILSYLEKNFDIQWIQPSLSLAEQNFKVFTRDFESCNLFIYLTYLFLTITHENLKRQIQLSF